MTQELRDKLIAQGAEALADALLALAEKSKTIEKTLLRLVAVPDHGPQIRKQMNTLGRWRNRVDDNAAGQAASDMCAVLDQIRTMVSDPVQGAELVIEFYKTDTRVFESTDDSDGVIANVYREQAMALLVHYAHAHPDQKRLADALVELNQKDDYNVRSTLVHGATQYLSDDACDHMMATLFKAWSEARLALQSGAVTRDKSYLRALPGELLLMSLAKQRRNGKMFECIELASTAKPGTAACIAIARVYLSAGDLAAAQGWSARIDSRTGFMEEQIDQLRFDIAVAGSDTKERNAVAIRQFQRARSIDAFNTLLEIVGEEQREQLLDQQHDAIANTPELCLADAQFLLDVGRLDDTEAYLLARVSQLTGLQPDPLPALPALADKMLRADRMLVASLLYRASIDVMLNSVRVKAYPNGRKYLAALDELSSMITDWQGAVPHSQYRAELASKHAKKTSFWTP